MLVLTRKEGQMIDIGHGLVRVFVKRIRGGKVSLAVDAPRELTVNRSEVERRTKEESTDA